MRIVRAPDNVRYDPSGKADGRGAYLHDRRSCWERALKGSLAVTLKTVLTQEDLVHLYQVMENLPEEIGE